MKLTPLRKIGAGLFLMAGAFALSSTIQSWIDAGQRPNIGWQILATYLLRRRPPPRTFIEVVH